MSDKKSWEETIKYIRTQPEYQELVEKAYFEEDLHLNVERFRKGEEFAETLNIVKQFQPNAQTMLDIGSGNGISAVTFALAGYTVTTVEPDASETIGAGAIRKLKEYYSLDNLTIHEAFAEEINFSDNSFDIVYARQCMHHAYDLPKFVGEACRVLKKGGLLLTVRDHVVFNKKDKEWFLERHPLHKFYGGENAFTLSQYTDAFQQAGLCIDKVLKHFDSVINYYPLTQQQRQNLVGKEEKKIKNKLKHTLGTVGKIPLTYWLYKKIKYDPQDVINEMNVPGRLYSFICRKV